MSLSRAIITACAGPTAAVAAAHSPSACSRAPAALAEGLDAAGSLGPLQVAPWKALVQRGERAALGRVALAHDLGEAQRPRARGPRRASQPPACTEASWPGSPIAITFAPARSAASSSRALGRVGAIPASSRITHAPLRQLVAELLEVDQQPVERARRDPGLLGELARRAAGGRDADHLRSPRVS